ncbi:MAG: hypothetical protein RQM92_09755 [Candidatus Syntrophopropionicum ammoniitolerans]
MAKNHKFVIGRMKIIWSTMQEGKKVYEAVTVAMCETSWLDLNPVLRCGYRGGIGVKAAHGAGYNAACWNEAR